VVCGGGGGGGGGVRIAFDLELLLVPVCYKCDMTQI